MAASDRKRPQNLRNLKGDVCFIAFDLLRRSFSFIDPYHLLQVEWAG
jgi:hypothetical protein